MFGCGMVAFVIFLFFFFSSRRRHTRYIGDWSSDECSSDLRLAISCRDFSHSVSKVRRTPRNPPACASFEQRRRLPSPWKSPEIGRASCRERVKVSVVDASCEKQSEKQRRWRLDIDVMSYVD